tara:strand:+ start:9617 stop:10906 length:1290 start_codon:yes stop_codon:yes gene_type:complete
MTKFMTRLAVLIALVAITLEGEAQQWGQFRGATGSGVSASENLPTTWSDDSVLWSVNLLGQGNSSPAVNSSAVFVTSQAKDLSLHVLAFSCSNGKPLWKKQVGSGKLAAKGPANLYAHRHNAATPSPIADDQSVWAFFGTGLLVCLDARTGELKWEVDMVQEYGAYDITFGMGSTPRLWEGHVFVSCMTKGASYVVALNKDSGELAWKHDRRFPSKDDGPDAYSTPIIATVDGKAQLIVTGCDHINAYNPKTGEQLWYSSGLQIASPYGRVIASPVAGSGVVVGTSANPGGGGLGHVMAWELGGKGNVRETNMLWRHARSTPDSSTPIAVNGLLFALADNGVCTCLDIKTGDVKWVKRLTTGTSYASLVAGGGKVYASGINGTVVVFNADSEGKVVATNKLEGQFYSTPALMADTIYLRAYERLVAVKK